MKINWEKAGWILWGLAGWITAFLIAEKFFSKPPNITFEINEEEAFYQSAIELDSRFNFLNDELEKRAVFHCGKRLGRYVNDPIGFLLALICVESDFRHEVIGKKGEIGILQIHPLWTKEIKREILEHKFENICFGVKILEELFKRYNDVFLVLRAWNTGSISKSNQKFIDRFFTCADKVGWQKEVRK